MALGGGIFTEQNKDLPGAYMNFVSAASAGTVLTDRGIVTMPLELDWGVSGEVFEVTNKDFRENSREIFGYAYDHESLKGLRDLFLNARVLYAYRLNGGEKAGNDYAQALYPGIRGNDIKISVQVNVDDETAFDVKTILDAKTVDMQTVKTAGELKANKYVSWKPAASLAPTAGTPLTGGTNGTANGEAYQDYLDKIETYAFHAMGAVVTDETTKALLAAFVKRMRDEVGIKFQLVLHDYAKADYHGVISVKNKTADNGWGEAGLVYWAAGISAGCSVNRSNQNRIYDGEFDVKADYTQAQLKEGIRSGEFMLHKVGSDLRVLEDINTKVTVSDAEGDIFKENQTIRVIDQIGNDIAAIFNTKYLGIVPSDHAGRASLWSDIVTHHRELERMRAIEDFSEADVSVIPGDTKKSVVISDAVTIVNTMGKLYMNCVIR